MPIKLGRNDTCWCGSGKKYKKCHLGRQEQEPARPWEVDDHIRARSRRGECLHVGAAAGKICGKPAIGSHTVPRKMLKQIARNGHVYYHAASIQDLEKSQGRIGVKLIGVNDASVLPIFCQTHDGGTFAPLEQAQFTGSQEQCFLLAYRALCHEYSKKRDSLDSIPLMKGLDRGKPVERQIDIQMTMDALAASYKLSLRDLDKHKEKFDSMLSARDFSDMRAYMVTLKDLPEILCGGVLYPECDFAGRPLQDLGDQAKTMELVTFSLITAAQEGAFVFAWDNSSDAICRALAKSLDQLSDVDLTHALVRFIFEFCENHYFNPNWWAMTDQRVKNALTDRFQVAASAWLDRSSGCLLDDGLRAVSWTATKRDWV